MRRILRPADPATRVIPETDLYSLPQGWIVQVTASAMVVCYDRTLPLLPDIKTIGVLYAGQLLEDIHPQAHDVPLDGWVTEQGLILPAA